MILHSKITKITPKCPQITQDHTRSSQEHAFGTCFLTGPYQNSFFSLSPSPESNGPPRQLNSSCAIASYNNWTNKKPFGLGKHLLNFGMSLHGHIWALGKTCTTRVVPFNVGEYTFWKEKKQALCITSLDHKVTLNGVQYLWKKQIRKVQIDYFLWFRLLLNIL